MPDKKEVTLSYIIGKYKTKDHFISAYEQKGKLIPKKISFGWNFIKQILSGEKRLLNTVQVEELKIPPRYIKKT